MLDILRAGIAVTATGLAIAPAAAEAVTDSALTAVTSALPAGNTKFTSTVSNGTAANEQMDVFAICGHKPTGYRIVRSSSTSTQPVVDTFSTICAA